MPRTGGVYSLLSGSKGSPNTTIQSSSYNSQLDDFAQDANLARPITAGGTGATTASGARSNLSLVPGADIQAYDAGLQSIAGLTTLADQMLYTTGSDAYATTSLTPFARTILDDVDAAAARTTLGLGALATKGSVSDADWSGADLSIANGGTGASTAAAARENLGLGNVSNTSDANKPVSTAQQTELDKKSNRAGDTFTGDMLFGSGTGGRYSKLQANGDVQLNRGDNTGYITWNVANAYFGYDGTRYGLGPAGDLVIGKGILQVEKNGLIAQYYETGDIVFSGGQAGEFGPTLSSALRGYSSAQQTWTAGGSLVVAHGLGIVPKNILLIFVCKVASSGYAVGDRIVMAASQAQHDENYTNTGFSVSVDATNVRVSFGSNGIPIVAKTGGGVTFFGSSQFDVVVTARL